jgi:hypothetical protein
MTMFAPDLRRFQIETLAAVQQDDPSIEYPYEGHPFAGFTFNIGPSVVTTPHKDLKNLSWGWCAITSLGNYNPKNGGHLVLWDLNLVIEFPPGSTIFIPSAILCHSNTSVSDSETRSSLTQYNSEGLFRWAAYDFSLKKGRKKVGSSGGTLHIQCSPRYVSQ